MPSSTDNDRTQASGPVAGPSHSPAESTGSPDGMAVDGGAEDELADEPKAANGQQARRKRKRKIYSCVACYSRKVKCDLVRPTCTNCIRRKESCEWTEPAMVPAPPPPPPSSSAIAEEIISLESRLNFLKGQNGPPISRAPTQRDTERSSESLSPGSTVRSPPIPHRSTMPSFPYPAVGTNPHYRHTVTFPRPSAESSIRTTALEYVAVPTQSDHTTRQDMYSHDTFDHHILKPAASAGPFRSTASSEAGSSRPSTKRKAPPEEEEEEEVQPSAPGEGTEPKMFIAFPFNVGAAASISRNQLLQAVIDSIPPKAETDALMIDYFTNVEWMTHPVDVHSFWSSYLSFWRRPPDQRGLSTPPKWLALFTMMLSLAFHFCREDVVREEMLYQSSQVSLSLSNFLFDHSLESIACIILMGLRLNNRNASHCHQILLALAIRMAQSMGLHRLEPDGPGERSPATREYGRRLWYQLVYQDAYNASGCGFSYNVVAAQNKTILPLNIYDAELRPDVELRGRPRTEMTEQSYHNEKIAFAQLARQFVDLATGDREVPYESILDLDRAYRAVYDSLPPFLNPDLAHLHPSSASSSPSRTFERLFIGFTFHNRLMRLHRPYMARGFKDPRYRFSTDAAVTASRACLNLARQGQATGFPGLKWWVVLQHLFTSGIVSIIALFHISGSLDDPGVRAQVSEGRDYVSLAIKVLSAATNISFVASRAVEVLEAMLEQETARRTNPNPHPSSRPTPSVVSTSEDGNVFEGPVDWTAILNAMPGATASGAVDGEGAEASAAFWDGVANVDLDGMFAMGSGPAEGTYAPIAF